MTKIIPALNNVMLDKARVATEVGEFESAFEYLLAVLAVEPEWIDAHAALFRTAGAFWKSNGRALADFGIGGKTFFGRIDTFESLFGKLADSILAISGVGAVSSIVLNEDERKALLLLARYFGGDKPARASAELLRLVDILRARLILRGDAIDTGGNVGWASLPTPAAAFPSASESYDTQDMKDRSDDLFTRAVTIVINEQKFSIGYLQQRLGIGYMRAADLVERMMREGILNPARRGKKRKRKIERHDS